MDEARAREILGECIGLDNRLGTATCFGGYLDWSGSDIASVDNDFATADQLEAIAWWMKNKRVER